MSNSAFNDDISLFKFLIDNKIQIKINDLNSEELYTVKKYWTNTPSGDYVVGDVCAIICRHISNDIISIWNWANIDTIYLIANKSED